MRLEIPLRDSIQFIGHRSENLYKYTSYFDKCGKIRALEFVQYADSGVNDNDGKCFSGPFVLDLTGIVQGPWEISHVRYSSVCVKTQKPPSTFMRSPGVMCSAFFLESVFQTASKRLAIDILGKSYII